MGRILDSIKAFFSASPAPEPVKPWTAAELAVAKGAGMLDLINPNWAEWVNPDTLNIWNPQTCVLGQLYGFTDGHELLERTFGYEVFKSGFTPVGDYSNEELNSAWRAAILNRVY